ncbi:MAG: hypothetical protein AAGA02_11530 [Bacteroidota bacterium]
MKKQITRKMQIIIVFILLLIAGIHAQDVSLKSPKELFKEAKARIELPFTISKVDKLYKHIKRAEKLLEKYSKSRKQKREKIVYKLDTRLPDLLSRSEQQSEQLLTKVKVTSEIREVVKVRKNLTVLRERLLTLSNSILLSPDISKDIALRPHVLRLIVLETNLSKLIDHTQFQGDENA